MKILEENKGKKFLEIFIYLLIFCTFMGSNFLKFNISGINFNFARVLMIISSIIVFIHICTGVIQKKKNILNIKSRSVKYCVFFFIIWSLYSIITIYKSLNLIDYLIMGFFICIGTANIIFFVKYFNIEEKKYIIFNMINIPVFLNCIYYIFLYFVKNENIGGLYHNSNDLATVLLLTMPIAIYLIANTKNILHKSYNIIFLVVYIFCFVNITSRACMLGLILAILIFCIFIILKNRKKILENRNFKILIIILFIVCLLVGIYVYIHYVGKLSFVPIENAKTSNEVRTNLIFNGLYFLTQDYNLIFGIGSGNNRYYLENYSIYSINNIYNFHNLWLDIVVEYGIFIFIGFISVYIIICKELYKISGDKFVGKINTIYLFFLLSFVIASISSSTIITREWLWIIFAMIISYINYQKDEEI